MVMTQEDINEIVRLGEMRITCPDEYDGFVATLRFLYANAHKELEIKDFNKTWRHRLPLLLKFQVLKPISEDKFIVNMECLNYMYVYMNMSETTQEQIQLLDNKNILTSYSREIRQNEPQYSDITIAHKIGFSSPQHENTIIIEIRHNFNGGKVTSEKPHTSIDLEVRQNFPVNTLYTKQFTPEAEHEWKNPNEACLRPLCLSTCQIDRDICGNRRLSIISNSSFNDVTTQIGGIPFTELTITGTEKRIIDVQFRNGDTIIRPLTLALTEKEDNTPALYVITPAAIKRPHVCYYPWR